MTSSIPYDPAGSPAQVPGFKVGHCRHPEYPTGCTVVLCPPGTLGGASVMGSAAGTRQCDGLFPGHVVEEVHAVFFTGGSSLGLGAADGVQSWLAGQGIGLGAGQVLVPVVPTAVIFDLPLTMGQARMDPELARQACQEAGSGPMARGDVGAGSGATVGKLFGVTQACKGGLGGASLARGALKVGVLAVVNAFGDVLDEQGLIMAGARCAPESLELADTAGWFLGGGRKAPFGQASNTTLAVVATNARLDKMQACKVASLAHQGLVRCLDPVHTTMDGDLVVVLASGQVEADLNGLGVMAAHLLAHAVRDGVRSSTGLPGLPPARELTPRPRPGLCPANPVE